MKYVSISVLFVACVGASSLFPSLPINVKNTKNELCNEESLIYKKNLENFTSWAYEIWDATAQSTAGILSGSIVHYGNFEQCLKAKAPFPVQYCLTKITANFPKPMFPIIDHSYESVWHRIHPSRNIRPRNVIRLGWCIPASCEIQDLELFLQQSLNESDFKKYNTNITYAGEVAAVLCQSQKDDSSFNLADVLFCVVTVTLISLVIYATAFENETSWISAFSVKKNYADLVKLEDANPALTQINGIRTFSIICVIFGHRSGMLFSFPISNVNEFENIYRSLPYRLAVQGALVVDTLFFLSGLLVSYNLSKQLSRKTNVIYLILVRYFRLMPTFAFVTFYYSTLLEHTGSGPLWKFKVKEEVEDCENNWWTNLLLVNNYVNSENMCMIHAWYIPCDFHLYLIAIGIHFLMTKKNIFFGLITLGILTLVSMIIPFALVFIFQSRAMWLIIPEVFTSYKKDSDFQLTYIKSHTRATVYFIGMFTGYIYYQLRDTKRSVSKCTSNSVFLGSILLLSAGILSGTCFYDPDYEYTSIEAALYAGLHKMVFGMGIAGFMYAVSFDQGCLSRNILSWWPWNVLGNLSYGAYLSHMQFQYISAAKFANPHHITYFSALHLGIGDVAMAFATSFAMYLTIEAPFRKLIRIVLSNKERMLENKTETKAD